jgi:hypothetical protein
MKAKSEESYAGTLQRQDNMSLHKEGHMLLIASYGRLSWSCITVHTGNVAI